MPMPTFPLVRLAAFRTELHACFTRRADALFDLGDALLCAPAISSLPHLSLEPVHRRSWGSAYAALARGEVDAERLRDLLASALPHADPLVFAVEVTTWPRCDAECSLRAATTTTPRGTRPASRSSPAGPTSGSSSWASTATPGPPRSTRRGCTPWTTPTRPPPARSAHCWTACPRVAQRRCSCSTAATTPPSCPSTSPTLPQRCWCGCDLTAASTPTRHPADPVPPGGRAAMGPSSTAPTRPPGRLRPPPLPATTISTAP
jgi:hypothetical protein